MILVKICKRIKYINRRFHITFTDSNGKGTITVLPIYRFTFFFVLIIVLFDFNNGGIENGNHYSENNEKDSHDGKNLDCGIYGGLGVPFFYE